MLGVIQPDFSLTATNPQEFFARATLLFVVGRVREILPAHGELCLRLEWLELRLWCVFFVVPCCFRSIVCFSARDHILLFLCGLCCSAAY